MTFALTAFKAYGIRTSGANRQHTHQVAELKITSANTDVDLDIGDTTGTFWTAAQADSTYGTMAARALTVMTNIQAIAQDLKLPESEALSQKTPVPGGGVMTFLSAASVGGAPAETYTVTGLLSTDTILSVVPKIASATGRAAISVLAGTVPAGAATGNATVTGLVATDTILAVTQDTKGANSLPLIGYGVPGTGTLPFVYSADPGANGTLKVLISRAATTDTYVPVSYGSPAADQLVVTYGANPGAGAKVTVTVYRPSSVTPVAGEYSYSVSSHLPIILFASGDAPTSQLLKLVWTIDDGVEAYNADYGSQLT